MTTTRTRKRPPRGPRITQEAVDLFRRVCAMQDNDGCEEREYLDACLALHCALGLMPWDIDSWRLTATSLLPL